jgi:hypothetical protein
MESTEGLKKLLMDFVTYRPIVYNPTQCKARNRNFDLILFPVTTQS